MDSPSSPPCSSCHCVPVKLEIGAVCVMAVVLLCNLVFAPFWMRARRRLAKLGRAALHLIRRTGPSDNAEEGAVGLRYYPKACKSRTHRRPFTLTELRDATNGFHCKFKLGAGGFGSVYKGVLADGTVVAVKRCSSPIASRDRKEIQQFLAEVSLITELTHPNLVPLRGWCREGCELLLVYEFMPNGSLDRHVRNSVLPWPQRYSIVVDIATALQFLHSRCKKGCIIHRDVKASNVLIDGQMRARLGDFGMARQVECDRTPLQYSSIAGTKGYMAPEAAYGFRATEKMDVFSFGVLVLEIVAGRAPIDLRGLPEEAILIDWVWQLHVAGRLLEAADKRLVGHYKVDEMSRLLHLGLICSSPDPEGRCDMNVVMEVLTREAPPPPLPKWRPVPFFTAEQKTQEAARPLWSSPSPSPHSLPSTPASTPPPPPPSSVAVPPVAGVRGPLFSSPPIIGQARVLPSHPSRCIGVSTPSIHVATGGSSRRTDSPTAQPDAPSSEPASAADLTV